MTHLLCALLFALLGSTALTACGGGGGGGSGDEPDAAHDGDGGGPFDAGPSDDATPPQDPSTLAPPGAPGVTTDFYASVRFLFEEGVQTGLTPGAIEPHRAAVVRGRVLDEDGAPLAAARVRVLGHPELGQTLSRADGRYDLVVNGGQRVVLRIVKPGFLETQRGVVPPFRDFRTVGDVRLVPLDDNVTTVTLGTAMQQVAAGSVVNDGDGDGPRQARVVFPAGTTAELVHADGSTTPLASAAIRATEFTVGEDGQERMPGELPPATGYTYAVELSADEAIAAGAVEVRFSQPVVLHVDNFLGFPAGDAVPLGYFDRERGVWIAAPNGRVIDVLGVASGLAQLDADGDGDADDAAALAALGVTDDERRELAARFPSGGSLWRSPIPHFTPWDCNWPYSMPPGSDYPPGVESDPLPGEGAKHPCLARGSILGCETRTLGERLGLAGVPFDLMYTSARAPGRVGSPLVIPLTGAAPPGPITRVLGEIEIAGRTFTTERAPAPNLSWTVEWDGRDAYGRPVWGHTVARGRIGYEYVPVALSSRVGAGERAFGLPTPDGTGVTYDRSALVAVLWRDFETPVNAEGMVLDGRLFGVGGWSLTGHHIYDPRRHAVHTGDGLMHQPLGARVTDSASLSAIAVAGTERTGDYPGEGVIALETSVGPGQLAGAPDGGFWLSRSGVLKRVFADGTIDPVVGCDPDLISCPAMEDGRLVEEVEVITSFEIASAPDGSLVFSGQDYKVWRIDPEGRLHWLAGSGSEDPVPLLGQVGGPARSYDLDPREVAVGPLGDVYLIHGHSEVYRITLDGRLEHIAGLEDGTYTLDGVDGPATRATFDAVTDLAVDREGDVYLGHESGRQAIVLRVGRDGRMTHFAGRTTLPESGACQVDDRATTGQRRLEICLGEVKSLGLGPEGAVHVMDGLSQLVRLTDEVRVLARGVFLAPHTLVIDPFQMELSPHFAASAGGGIFVASQRRIYELGGTRAAQILGDDNVLVPSPDGAVAWIFDASGRHLETRDLLTGAPRQTFAYGSHGFLTTITDGDGHVTTIERDAAGAPTAIAAAGGQRTTLTVNAQGYLTSVTAPDGGTIALTYAGVGEGAPVDSGLLRTLTAPGGGQAAFTWSERGDLVSDTDATGGVTTLARVELADGHEVRVTDPVGRVRTHRMRKLPGDVIERQVVQPTGGITTVRRTPEGLTTMQAEDGTVVEMVSAPDPRFGDQIPLLTQLRVRKGDRQTSVSTTRTITDYPGFFGDGAVTETTSINNEEWTTVFDAASRRLTRTTPTGRVQVAQFDERGRAVSMSIDPALSAITRTYGADGFVSRITMGRHGWDLTWNDAHLLESVTDATGRDIAYTFDAAGRPENVSYPSGTVAMGWDDDGNLASFSLPGGAAHAMTHDALGQQVSYTPPGGSGAYASDYGADRALVRNELPSGRAQVYSHDAGGRPIGIATDEAAYAFSYEGTTWLPATLSRTPTSGPAQSLSFTHDVDLPVQLVFAGAANGTFAYTYDRDFLLTSVTLNAASTEVSYPITRNDDGLLTAFGPLTFTRGGPAGAVSAITDGGASHAFSYLAEGHLDSHSHVAGGVTRYALTLGYDDAGLPASRSETVGGVTTAFTYEHDGDGRLVRVTRGGVEVEAYTYDARGNRTAATLEGQPAEVATYDAQDRLVSHGATPYTVDDDGFTVARGTDTFTWSTTGELLDATVGGVTVTYAYDALRRRVQRAQGASVTQYLYGDVGDPFKVTASIAPDGTLTSYLYDERGHVTAFERGGQRFFVATDQVGSPRVITSSAGAVVATFTWDSFGRPRGATGSVAIDFGYAGGLADAVTGLVRFGFRDYDPRAGRWLARDPAFLAGRQWNLYAYVGSSPVGRRDPTGLFCVGATYYSGIGGGGSICASLSGGVSACAEIGVSAAGGVGLELQPFAQPDHVTFGGVELSGGINAGPFAGFGGEYKYGQYGNPYEGMHCFKGGGGFKGSLIAVETDLKGLESGKSDLVKAWDLDGAINDKRIDVGIDAKAAWKQCGSVSNLF